FFFQAEDGIRDFHVTGVQTCALPISLNVLADYVVGRLGRRVVGKHPRGSARRAAGAGHRSSPRAELVGQPASAHAWREDGAARRSEERRVGKECRDMWMPEP